jgi:hypothetical protein
MSDNEPCVGRERFIVDTLTVGRLIDILSKYPKQMKVMITWESTVNELKEEWIYEAKTGSLYLDGDAGFYKDEFKR